MFTSCLLKLGGILAAVLMVISLGLTGAAEARMGGSFGSRGFRTFSSPAITQVAPNAVAPITRSMTPNGGGDAAPYHSYGRGGFWPGFGGGILGGVLGGLLFHGLFGSMLGFGFGGFGGGFSSIFQLLLVGGLIWFVFSRFRGRPAGSRGFGGFPPDFGGGPGGDGSGPNPLGGPTRPWGGNRDEIGISNGDLAGFERLLAEVQEAFAHEDHQSLRRLATPEMVSYFSEELAQNAERGVRNEVTGLRFIKGELAEAWREGSRDYATLAMNWSAIDILRNRATGEVVQGNPDQPVETTEIWTFVRDGGGPWLLSAIQEARG